MIKVEIVKCLKDNFSYIVHNNNEALVIDPIIRKIESKIKIYLKYTPSL